MNSLPITISMYKLTGLIARRLYTESYNGHPRNIEKIMDVIIGKLAINSVMMHKTIDYTDFVNFVYRILSSADNVIKLCEKDTFTISSLSKLIVQDYLDIYVHGRDVLKCGRCKHFDTDDGICNICYNNPKYYDHFVESE